MKRIDYEPLELHVLFNYDGPDQLSKQQLESFGYTIHYPYFGFRVNDDAESLWDATYIKTICRQSNYFGFDGTGNYLFYCKELNDYIIIRESDYDRSLERGVVVNPEIIKHFAAWYCPDLSPDLEFDEPESDMPDIF